MFLSFVIPLYNCQQYIDNCLGAILACGLPKDNYEVVLVDDGSKDDGTLACTDYARRHDNILLYQQPNDGPATARNNGLDHAQGEFVWFVDADDEIEPGILKKLKEGAVQFFRGCPPCKNCRI